MEASNRISSSGSSSNNNNNNNIVMQSFDSYSPPNDAEMSTFTMVEQHEDDDVEFEGSETEDESMESYEDEEETDDSSFDYESDEEEQFSTVKIPSAYVPADVLQGMICPCLTDAMVTNNVRGLVAMAGDAQKQQGSTALAEDFVLEQLLRQRFQKGNVLHEYSVVQTMLPTQSLTTKGLNTCANKSQKQAENPKDLLLKRIEQVTGRPAKPVFYKNAPEGFFDGTTEADIAAYDKEITDAVRDHDYEKVKNCYYNNKDSNPRILQCSNKFGESLVHMAARRGCHHILRFMIEQASVSVKLVCDSGRTPLHDACWTSAPNFEVVRELTKVSPDLWLVQDKRGFVPLQYVPRDCWEEWCAFLISADGSMLTPKELL